jgi:hypothetical protein
MLDIHPNNRGGPSMLDSVAIKAADRLQHGLPVVFHGETQYGHVLRDGELVCVPKRPRTRTRVSFAGLFA